MEVLYPRCAGLDVHKESVVACIRIASGGEVVTEVHTFNTTTASLVSLSEWLASNGCTHVAMEATGVYWKPVWHILSDSAFTLVLANAAHVKNVSGRKTDINDATWLADLLAHGLIRASFVPESETQDMRALLRTRKQLVREKASHIQRLQKTLEDGNIKLDSVVADIVGKSGRAIIDALIAGESDPASRRPRPAARPRARVKGDNRANPPFYGSSKEPLRSDKGAGLGALCALRLTSIMFFSVPLCDFLEGVAVYDFHMPSVPELDDTACD